MRSLLIHDIKIMRLIMNYLINITLNHAVSNLELKIRVRVVQNETKIITKRKNILS